MSFSSGHALIIGIGTYKHEPQINVPITTYEAKEVAEVLRDEKYCGYPPDQVTLLNDSDATSDRIMKELDRLSKQLKADHTLFFFYSGHGMHGYGEDDSYYLTTHDSMLKEDGENQGIVGDSAISGDNLKKAIENIVAKRIFLFFNACHSGALVSESLDSYKKTDFQGSKSLPTKLSEDLGFSEGRVTITACREEEQSSFLREDKLTFFGAALIEGLKGNNINHKNGFITILSLYSYIHEHVKNNSLHKRSKKQEPVIFTKLIGDMPIAQHRGSISYKLRQSIDIFSDNFKYKKIKDYIKQIDVYEEIYSLIDGLEVECFKPMVRDLRRINKELGSFEYSYFLENFEGYLNSVNLIYEQFKNIMNGNDIDSKLEKWLNNIDLSNKSLQNLIQEKNLNEFKKATWYIESIFEDEPQTNNNLLVYTATIISQNININELKTITIEPLSTNQEIVICVNDLLTVKNLLDKHIDLHTILGRIASRLVRHKGELDDPDLTDIFMRQVKIDIDLLSKVTNQQINLFFLNDWKTIEKERSSKRLASLFINIKGDFKKINKLIKNQCEKLAVTEDKLTTLNNIMEK